MAGCLFVVSSAQHIGFLTVAGISRDDKRSSSQDFSKSPLKAAARRVRFTFPPLLAQRSIDDFFEGRRKAFAPGGAGAS